MHRALNFFITAIIGGLTVLFFIGIRFGEPPWMQDSRLVIMGTAMAFAFVVGLAIVKSNLFPATNFFAHLLRAAAIASMTCLPVLVWVRYSDSQTQKLTLIIEVGIVFFLLIINGLGLSNRIAMGISLVVFAVGIHTGFTDVARSSFVQLIQSTNTELDKESNTRKFIFTPLHDVQVVNYPVLSRAKLGRAKIGGAMESLDDTRVLLVDAGGAFHQLTLDGGIVESAPLIKLRSPMNRAAYDRDVKFPSPNFRITDLLLVDQGVKDKRLMYLVHHQWDEQKKCFTLDVNEAELDLSSLDQAVKWRHRFRSKPCIPGDVPLKNTTGGRLAIRSPNSLLLTVGVTTQEYEEVDTASDVDVSYGKILELDRTSWVSRVFSTGHRNPQGLLVDDGTIWSTEHGPDGGDELNLIVEGANYGWPKSSHGVDYGKKTLKTSDTPGEHSIGVRPVFSWVPSIAVSRVIKNNGNGFSSWQRDLLVGSLSGRGNGYSIYRVRMHEGAVKTVERIYTGKRVRDMIQLKNGHILNWDGINIVQRITPGSHVFSVCSGCHVVFKGWPKNGIGPDLWGIIRKPVASVAGFTYSDAMKKLGGRWSKERLDWFLSDPQKAVPGTKMTVPGIKDRKKRQAIIEYLDKRNRL